MIATSTRIVARLALAAALLGSGPVSAAQPASTTTSVVVNPNGDLSPNRTSADLSVSMTCDAAQTGQTKTASMTVKIFQSVGRLLNIATTNPAVSLICTGNAQQIPVAVDAIPGLKLQPGPATVLVTLTETTTEPNPTPSLPDITTSITTEVGGKVKLLP